jgi:hypothetical protein
MKHYIPSTINLDDCVRQSNTDMVTNFDIHNLTLILHFITTGYNNSDYANGFTLLNSTILQSRIHNYREYLEYGLKTGLIETDNQYIIGKKSKGYRIAKQFQSIDLQRINCSKKNGRDNNSYKVGGLTYSHLTRYLKPNLDILYWEAKADIKNDYFLKLDNPHLREYDKNGRQKDPYLQYTAAYYNVEQIASGDLRFHVDTNVRRLHSNITNLPSRLRKYLRYDGQTLVSIDLKNAQPYLSIILLTINFWEEILNNPKKWKNIFYFLNKPYLYSSIMLVKSAVSQAGTDLYRFVAEVANGTFYESFANNLNTFLGYDITDYKALKSTIFTVLFTNNRYFGQDGAAPKRVFKSIYPSVYKIFSAIKKKDHTLLPRLLQLLESFLFLQVITKRIFKERPNLPIFTIHDSIATTEGNEDYVKLVMQDELKRATGYTPTLKIEYWK